ncbi:TPR-like protein [Curvularia clavata]|uniref:TPR-like protein n=1 Tax=Curvularia clavata TaxID=95742 RepID=A0A9Q8ZJY5_CURCL|nr:TPR-like protein [Curvularia clavata]
MFHTRRGSHASVPGVGSTQLRHFHTLKVADGAKQAIPELEVVLVHGCCNPRTHRIEKSLWSSATSIGKGIGQCRVHVFSYDAAKLLRKGKSTLDELARHLLEDVKDIPGVPRRTTGASQETDSSTGSDEHSMCVRMSPDEEEEIVDFLKHSKKITPSPIPTLPRASISEEDNRWRRSSMRSVSKGRYIASYDTQSTRSTDFVAGHAPTQAQRFVSPQPIRGIEDPFTPGIFDARLTESPQPLESAFRKSGPSARRVNVEFIQQKEQREYFVVIPGPESERKKSLEKSLEKNLKESKGIASWYLQNGDIDEAERLYKNLIEWCQINGRFDRGFWKMKLQIGQIRYIRGEYGSSEEQLDQLLEGQYKVALIDEPKEAALTAEIARWLALSQWRQGKYTVAQNTLHRCIEQLPESNKDDPSLLSILALVLASSGSLKRAWKLSTQAINPHHSELSGSEKGEDALSGHRGFCLVNHARISSAIGKLDEADQVNREALQAMEKHLGPKHFVTLDASSLQAWLLVARSKTSQAAEAVHRTLHEMRERFEEDHPSILQTLETLVLVYKSEGRYSDAEETATYLFRKNKQKLGDNHPQTLKSQSILAEIELSCGKWEVAEEMQRKAIELEEKRANDDIDYLGLYSYKTTLAGILRESGKWDEARKLSLHVLVEQLNKFGNEDEKDDFREQEQTMDGAPESNECIDFPRLYNLLASCKPIQEELEKLRPGLHEPTAGAQPTKIYPSIVQTLHCLALCEQVRDDADLEFAHGILNMVHEIRLNRLKEDHRLTVNVQYDLAVNYRLQGRLKESLDLIRDVVEKRRDSLGADHPDYLCAKHQEAVTLFQMGQWKQALQEQRRTLKAQEYLLGKTHSDTLLSRYTLGGLQHSLNSLRSLEQADNSLNEVITAQIDRYGENHPIVIRSRARRALILLDRGLLTQEASYLQVARKEQQVVVQQRMAQYHKDERPKSFSLIRSARNDLAQIIQASGTPKDLSEALNIYEDLVRTLPTHGKGIMGFEVRSNLASCHFKLGNYKEAEAIQRKIYDELKRLKDPIEHGERLVASTFNLALTVHSTSQDSRDRLTEACHLLKEAYDRARLFYEKDHPQTVELYTTLCDWQSREEKQKMGHSHTELLQDSTSSLRPLGG